MTKLLLLIALAASLLVPAGGVALALAAATAEPIVPSSDEIRPATEFDTDQIVAIRNELAELDRRATPGSTTQILEARRIAREARAWAVHLESEAEWEELASATSAADEAVPNDWHS